MPELCAPILEEILIKSIEKKNIFKPLRNFMFSGRNPFKIALMYFGRAEKVELEKGFCWITIEKNQRYKLSYDFPLMKPLLKVIGASIKELIIEELPQKEFHKRLVFDRIFGENLTKITVKKELPQKYRQKLKNHDSLEEIVVHSTNFSGFSMLSPSCKKVELHDFSFETLLNLKLKRETFPFIEELTVFGRFNKLNNNLMKTFSFVISKKFPNLKKINIGFGYYYGYTIDFYDDDDRQGFILHDDMEQIKAKMFQKLSSNLTGTICFNAGETWTTFEDARGYRSVRENFEMDEENLAMRRTLKVNNELVVKFILYFAKYEEASVYSYSDEY